MTLTFYEADGVAIRLAVEIEPGADAEALAGAAITVIAGSPRGEVEAGTAEIDGTDLILRYPPRALRPGKWTIQVRVIPPGHAGVTLREPLQVSILRSIGPIA